MLHAGVCALAAGISIIEVDIEIERRTAKIIAIDLLFGFCIFVFLDFISCGRSFKMIRVN
jgi:hypothetical protein